MQESALILSTMQGEYKHAAVVGNTEYSSTVGRSVLQNIFF